MKATKLLIAAAAFASLASLSFAGPSPEYWARMKAAEKTVPAPALSQTKAPESQHAAIAEIAACCTACAGCEARKS